MSLELPKGRNQIEYITVHVKTGSKKCPVVDAFIKRQNNAGSFAKVLIPSPDSGCLVPYDPMVSLSEINEYWIKSALKHAGGNVTKASKILKIGKEIIYRHLKNWRT